MVTKISVVILLIEAVKLRQECEECAGLAHMRKVVGYIHRHLEQGPSKTDPATSDWRYSLMNWGHDPQKR